MKPYRKHPAVPPEVEAAALWYKKRREGLGEDFVSSVEDAMAVICESPGAWPGWPDVPPSLNIRRFTMRRFPFAIAYLDEPAEVVILAVAHTKREPLYWIERTHR